MRVHFHSIATALIISTAYAYPLAQVPMETGFESRSNEQDLQPQKSRLLSTSAKIGIAGTAGLILLGTGLGFGISEWALHLYNRFVRDRNDRDQQYQNLNADREHWQEECLRRERAMDLILAMAERYSDKIGANPDFDGNFVPLMVPAPIVAAVENVFEQTSEVERFGNGEKRGPLDSLDELKEVIKPVLDFNGKKSEEDNA